MDKNNNSENTTVSTTENVNNLNAKVKTTKGSWLFGPEYLLFWLVLFFGVILSVYHKLPATKTIMSTKPNANEFIAERAFQNLNTYDKIGLKLFGTDGNENLTVKFLINEITQIKKNMRTDLFDLAVEVTVSSGAFPYKGYLSAYHAAQNVVVKFNTKNNTNQNYLLINSHFDSKPGSPGTGDDGTMVVNMLEVLRVLSTHEGTYEHPIIFLFNGAEEVNMRGSHAFITTHRWARNIAAVINLDCSGSGNRELLFQHSTNHPWLIKYYKENVKHPYGYVVAEELFQSGILPSDTDFYIFKNFANIPGFDMAYINNGYVYHTVHDSINVIQPESLQHTGDNLLALAKALANAPELNDPKKYVGESLIFFDFMGLFFIYYTTSLAGIINFVTALCAIFIAFFTAIHIKHKLNLKHIITDFVIIFILHLLGIILALLLPVAIAFALDKFGQVLSWFTNIWLIFGLYICPALFGLLLPTMIYLKFHKNSKLTVNARIHLILNSNGILMSILLIIGTLFNIKSIFLVLVPLIFYASVQIMNLIWSEFSNNPKIYYYWNYTIFLSQIVPFLLIGFIYHTLLLGIIPITGRIGASLNVDLVVAALSGIITILLVGFTLPLLNATKRSVIFVLLLIVTTIIFIVLSQKSQIGFPFRPKTNVERITFQSAHRVFYEHDGAILREDSGIYFLLDHRHEQQFFAPFVDVKKINSNDDCTKYTLCGLPIYNYMWLTRIKEKAWLPLNENIKLPFMPQLQLISRVFNNDNGTTRFKFSYTGTHHMGVILQPLEGTTITDWSFSKDFLKTKSPYFTGYVSGKELIPLEFFIEIQKSNGSLSEPLFELAVLSHFIDDKYERDPIVINFKKQFPSYTFVLEWPSSYQRYIF